MSSSKKFLKKVLKRVADAEGWDYWTTKKGYMISPPSKEFSPIAVHKTVSDHRAEKNLKARLKKAGLKVDDL